MKGNGQNSFRNRTEWPHFLWEYVGLVKIFAGAVGSFQNLLLCRSGRNWSYFLQESAGSVKCSVEVCGIGQIPCSVGMGRSVRCSVGVGGIGQIFSSAGVGRISQTFRSAGVDGIGKTFWSVGVGGI